MADAANQIYAGLNSYARLNDLLGEPEDIHLECKAPASPHLGQELKVHLAKAISGFSNTAGGVIIWGISTTKREHSGLDILTQVEPVPKCNAFEKLVSHAIPILTMPSVLGFQTKVLKKKSSDTSGVIIAYIPQTKGDPVQSLRDNIFYFRSGDNFVPAPYNVIKSLFSATDIPDLYPIFSAALVALQEDGSWEIPFAIGNRSSAIGEHVTVSLRIENPTVCEQIKSINFKDVSNINPPKKMYIATIKSVVHRGLNIIAGKLLVKMKKAGKYRRRRLDLSIEIFAHKMRPPKTRFTIQLAKKGFNVKKTEDSFVY